MKLDTSLSHLTYLVIGTKQFSRIVQNLSFDIIFHAALEMV